MMKKFVLFLALLLSSPVHAQTIDALGAGAAVTDTDLYPSYQGASPAKRVTAAQVKTYANTSAVRATTTTGEAIANSDQNKLVTFSNAAAVACTIAQAGSGGNFAAGWAVSLKNLGAGTVTCTPSTSTVDGAANFTLTTGQGVDLYSDGANYFTQPGKGSSPTTDASLLTSGTLAAARLPAFTGDCTASAGTGVLSCQTLGFPYRTSSFHIAGAETMSAAASNSSTLTANVARCYPGFLRAPGGTVTSIGVRVNTTAGASGIDLAVYLNNPTTTRPTGLPLFNTLNLSGAAAAFVSGAVSYAFTQNLQVWFCAVSNSATVTTNGATATLATSGLMGGAANTVLSGTAMINGVTFAQTQNAGWIDLTSPPAFTEVATVTHNMIILGF